MTSAPNREISYRLAPVAISSIAQHASPIGIGQSEFLRPQFAPGVQSLAEPADGRVAPGDDYVALDLRVVAYFRFVCIGSGEARDCSALSKLTSGKISSKLNLGLF